MGTAEAGDLFGAALATGPFDIGPSDLAIGAPFEARSQAFACSGRVTPATLVAFLRRSMGGVRPTLRPPGQPIGPRAGSQHSMAQVAVPGGRHPLAPRAATPPMSRLAPDGSGQRSCWLD